MLKKIKNIKHLFPKNYRFITERTFWLRVITVLGIAVIILLGVQFFGVYRRWQQIENSRQALLAKIALWDDIVVKFPGYRDAYFQLAILAYRVGDREKEKEYIQKVLAIDPRFAPVKALQHISNLDGEKEQ
ncbi:MAG: hypothetical protein ACREGI_03885 [Candidatus Levyibacteriota bacterium]